MSVKPSKMYIKHSFLKPGEWNPDIINIGDMDKRNIKPGTLDEKYYTQEEMEQMRNEIKQAVCPICDEEINDERCRICKNGHKFHSRCYGNQANDTITCPICRNGNIEPCKGDYNDFYSGGKKSKRRKTNRRKTNRRKTNRRKTNRRK